MKTLIKLSCSAQALHTSKPLYFRLVVKQTVWRAIEWFLDHPLWDSFWAAWAMIAVLWLIAAVFLALPVVLVVLLLRYFF